MERQVLAMTESVEEFGWVLILFFRIGTCVDQTQASLIDTSWVELGWTGNRVDESETWNTKLKVFLECMWMVGWRWWTNGEKSTRA